MAEYINELGYNLEEMWECRWKIKARVVSVPSTYKYPTEHRYRMSEQSILNFVRSGEIFGVIECDINVPQYLRARFSEMPPIFKNVNVTVEDIGHHMKQFCQDPSNNCTFKGTLV